MKPYARLLAVVISTSVGLMLNGCSQEQIDQEFQDCTDCPIMVVVPAGSFQMGSAGSNDKFNSRERPQHQVTISHDFAVGKFEVTFDEWNACVSAGGCNGYQPDDSGWGQGKRPVQWISWNDAKAYVEWLSLKTGKTYRLLSETEWEYAARAGTTVNYSWGDDIGSNQANCAICESQWDQEMTAPVGSFSANAFGLYDMHGNVYEWVEDCGNDDYSGAPNDGSARLGVDCDSHIMRSGNFISPPMFLRSASRTWYGEGGRSEGVGFRLARTLD